ncbi:MAG: hypothetical protein Q9215_005152 [Flavoplaca cf. flavocitrina]
MPEGNSELSLGVARPEQTLMQSLLRLRYSFGHGGVDGSQAIPSWRMHTDQKGGAGAN